MSMHPEQLELEDAFELHRPMAGVSTTATTTAAATLAAEPSSTLSLEHKEPQTLLSIVAGPFNSPHLQGKESMDDAIARHRTNSTASQPQLTQASALKNKKICRARSLPIIWSNSAEHGINLTMEEEAYLEKELYGLSAKAEEDLALQYGLELAAKRKHSIQRTQCTQQSGGGVGDGLSSGRDLEENGDEHNNGNEIEGTEAEKDNGCLSGICQPSSKFFRTSVICSNTMARDGLANERTFLSWLNAAMSLCLVSLTFITRALTLDNLAEDTQEGRESRHKDRVSRWIGYTCFACAFLSAIYSMFKYLKNIRRISTRYPFVQAGKWTFTVGMSLGTLIMVVLVLTYTQNI